MNNTASRIAAETVPNAKPAQITTATKASKNSHSSADLMGESL